MLEYRRILVPMDFSDGAQHALAYATALARLEKAELHVIHAIQEEYLLIPDGLTPLIPPAGYVSEIHKAAQSAVARIPEPTPPLASPMKRDVITSLPAKGIVDYAGDHGIDLICIGTHGRSGLGRFAIGSVAERVVQLAGCSVLVVRRKEHPFMSPDDGAVRINRILAPVDFSEFSLGAARHAFHVAARLGATVDLVHVVEENSPARSEALKTNVVVQDYLRNLVDSARTQLEDIQPAPESNVSVERHVRMGRPHVEILNLAKERFTDLIVTSTHGRTGIAHWFLGSVAEMVVRKAPCPVLVARPVRAVNPH